MKTLEKTANQKFCSAKHAEEFGYVEIDGHVDSYNYFNQAAKALGVSTWGNIKNLNHVSAKVGNLSGLKKYNKE